MSTRIFTVVVINIVGAVTFLVYLAQYAPRRKDPPRLCAAILLPILFESLTSSVRKMRPGYRFRFTLTLIFVYIAVAAIHLALMPGAYASMKTA